jgi:CRISPR-associated protein Csy3
MPIELPSVLAFERKLEVSDALMHAGDWKTRTTCDWKKIPITKRQNRSTQSPEGIADEKKSQPNPVASDSDDANLFQETDTLRVTYSLRVIGNLGAPFSCNSREFEEALINKVEPFKESDGLSELARRYAYNIANGRFLWRNRVGAQEIEIKVSIKNGGAYKFNAYDFSLQEFSESEQINELAESILTGLTVHSSMLRHS